jgi:hypothetical protein
MSEYNDYKDIDGNNISLFNLVRQEPNWAASRINHMRHENANLKKEVKKLQEQIVLFGKVKK